MSKVTFDQMTFDQMTFNQMTFDQMTFDQLTLDQMAYYLPYFNAVHESGRKFQIAKKMLYHRLR